MNLRSCALLGLILTLPMAAADWVDLLPNEKLEGWSHIPIPAISGVNPTPQWKVDTAARTLTCTGAGGHEWLRWDKEVGDFILEVDWRFAPKPGEPRYNSGIGIRLSQYGEHWVQAQTGQGGAWLFGQTITDGAMKRFNLKDQMTANAVKPVGEWNHFEIKAAGDTVTLTANGQVVNEVKGIGLRKGYIGLEAEGFEVSFKNLRIKTLN